MTFGGVLDTVLWVLMSDYFYVDRLIILFCKAVTAHLGWQTDPSQFVEASKDGTKETTKLQDCLYNSAIAYTFQILSNFQPLLMQGVLFWVILHRRFTLMT